MHFNSGTLTRESSFSANPDLSQFYDQTSRKKNFYERKRKIFFSSVIKYIFEEKFREKKENS